MESIKICRKILMLLLENDESNWVKLFDYFVQINDESYAKNGAREILKIYKGVGSFNDLVLHKDGLPSINANNQLQQLRSQLYESLILDITS